MEKRFYISIFLLLLVTAVFSFGQISERYKLTIQNSTNIFDHLVFGVDPLATSRIDTSLGEEELPPFVSPSGLYGVFLIYDSTYIDDSWGEDWSYTNLKPIPVNDDSIDYKFEVWDNGLEYTLKWDKLSEQIDSAILIDTYTHGAATFVNMKDSLKVTIINPSLTIFHIKLWYKTNTSVNQQIIENPFLLKIFPNPCTGILNIDFGKNDIYNIMIINLYGEKLIEEQLQGERGTLNFDILDTGIYFLIATNSDGIKSIIKLSKI
jgi:hypothetical protein